MSTRATAHTFLAGPHWNDRSGHGPEPGGRIPSVAVLAALVVLLSLGTLLADQPPVTRVEEDWVVEVGLPDPKLDAPQIATVISPAANLDGRHSVFELNHITQPKYASGGMQLQVWNGETNLGYCNFPTVTSLAVNDEVVTYTMSMSLANGSLLFEVVNGNSTTWGKFGGQGYLKANTATALSDLAGYSPATSTKYSRIGFASNQVKRFALKEVRYYSGTALVSTDTAERVVFQKSSE